MKMFVLLSVIITSITSFAATIIECSRGDDVLRAVFHEDHRDLIFGLSLNENKDEDGNFVASAGLSQYINILDASGLCHDISSFAGIEKPRFSITV